ncbi:ribosome-associated translation inhibitor RaiA [Candidatus Poribacteria bacterium]|nr:MAG: ribosome-associated translation inhibitor RaiA [Candidatus Poribacteria bacterium]
MEIQITTRNMELTDDIYEYVHKKLDREEKFARDIVEAHVIIDTVKHHVYTAEVSLLGKDVTFYAEAEGETPFAAIDLVMDKIDKQLRRHKERIKGRKHKLSPRQALAETQLAPEAAPEETSDEEVVKVDKFEPKPMHPDEAIELFKLSNDDLLMFVNSETNRINVLYRMRDGRIGWVEPEY